MLLATFASIGHAEKNRHIEANLTARQPQRSTGQKTRCSGSFMSGSRASWSAACWGNRSGAVAASHCCPASPSHRQLMESSLLLRLLLLLWALLLLFMLPCPLTLLTAAAAAMSTHLAHCCCCHVHSPCSLLLLPCPLTLLTAAAAMSWRRSVIKEPSVSASHSRADRSATVV
jgi:hypothetical protein